MLAEREHLEEQSVGQLIILKWVLIREKGESGVDSSNSKLEHQRGFCKQCLNVLQYEAANDRVTVARKDATGLSQ